MGCLCCRTCCGERQRPMEYSGAALLASATAPAHEDSSGQRVLALPLHECLPWKLSASKSITIRGVIPDKPHRWTVNLMSGGVGDDIALHINSRHDLGHVVRNSYLGGSWGTEEICGSPPMPFSPGEEFELVIFCSGKHFLLAVNNWHFARYAARSSVSSVSTLHVSGTLQLRHVGYADDVRLYPPQPAPALTLAGPGGSYYADKPVFPCRLPEPIQEGGEVEVSGRVKWMPFSFHIDLQHGTHVVPEPDILLHFSARFQVRSDFDILVLNSNVAGWGKEQRPKGFPFRPGRHFNIRFVSKAAGWEIYVDGKLIDTFPHRVSLTMLDAVHFKGDAIIDSVTYKPNSKDLIQL